jgi:hypothetical protein
LYVGGLQKLLFSFLKTPGILPSNRPRPIEFFFEAKMKLGSMLPMPWDLCVLLGLTGIGFGFSIQSTLHPDTSNLFADIEEVTEQAGATNVVPQILDFGCLDFGCIDCGCIVFG